MNAPITIERNIHFTRRGRGAPKTIDTRERETPAPTIVGRVPRVARLLALRDEDCGVARVLRMRKGE